MPISSRTGMKVLITIALVTVLISPGSTLTKTSTEKRIILFPIPISIFSNFGPIWLFAGNTCRDQRSFWFGRKAEITGIPVALLLMRRYASIVFNTSAQRISAQIFLLVLFVKNQPFSFNREFLHIKSILRMGKKFR